jgi:thiaminase (transcriptional activator TenA)
MTTAHEAASPPVTTGAPLREDLWAVMEPVHAAVLAHPFLTGLADGTLPYDRFRHFVLQDAHYLRGYARALAVCAAKAPTEADTAMLAAHASGAVAVEQEMHAELLDALGLTAADASETPVLPTTLAYTSYLHTVTYQGSFAEGLATVLPCYWIYARVGEALVARSSPDPLYARWVGMYGGEEFGRVVADVLALVDRVGAEASEAERDRMRGHAATTARYEWMFWDAAWRREGWPV